jgi:hypothetical protein
MESFFRSREWHYNLTHDGTAIDVVPELYQRLVILGRFSSRSSLRNQAPGRKNSLCEAWSGILKNLLN